MSELNRAPFTRKRHRARSVARFCWTLPYMSFDDEMNNRLISAVDELPLDDYFEELSFSYSDEVNENINETHKLMPVSDNYFAMDDCIYDDL